MPADKPDIALLISSYQRAWHLERVLRSVACQRDVDCRLEVVVTDDGSTDATFDVIRRFQAEVPYPVRFTTHRHEDFQLARCRNDGVRASTAPYLLFLDGDCLLPPEHVAHHLRRRRRGYVWGGYCCRLDRATSERVSLEDVSQAAYLNWASNKERWRLRTLAVKSVLYGWLGHPRKPRLYGGNIGIWRSDYERLNGYDENFVGWGGEDDDLRIRLGQAGVRVRSILPWTHTYHLWHPPVESAPAVYKQGRNIHYLNRRTRPTRCRKGLEAKPESLHATVATADSEQPPGGDWADDAPRVAPARTKGPADVFSQRCSPRARRAVGRGHGDHQDV